MATLLIKKANQILPSGHLQRARKLGKYINDPSKCLAKISKNFLIPDMTEEEEAFEIASLCAIVDPSEKKKIEHHWIISWKQEADDRPLTHAEIFKTADETMTALGYGNSPYRVAIHGNTEHLHAHIDVLRIDPETYRLIPDSFDYLKAQKAVAVITDRHGWKPEPGNWFKMENGETVYNPEKPKKRGGIRTRTIETEKITGQKSLERILQEFCEGNRQYFSAWKWGDLHKGLACMGVEMQYTDHNGTGGLAFSLDGQNWEKASSICPELAYPQISAALGAKSYRKARAEVKTILAEARKTREANNGSIQQQQRGNGGIEAGNNQPENGTIQNSTAIPERPGRMGRPVARETAPLSGIQPQNGDRIGSQESNIPAGQMEHPGQAEQAGRMDKASPETARGIQQRPHEATRPDFGKNRIANARGGAGTEQHPPDDKRPAGSAIQWAFTDESGTDNSERADRQARLDSQRLRERTEYHTAFLADKKKFEEKTRTLTKKINSLQTFYDRRFIKSKTLKERQRQKFNTLHKRLEKLQAFYDRKFIEQKRQANMAQEQDHNYMNAPN